MRRTPSQSHHQVDVCSTVSAACGQKVCGSVLESVKLSPHVRLEQPGLDKVSRERVKSSWQLLTWVWILRARERRPSTSTIVDHVSDRPSSSLRSPLSVSGR
ncbi:hypothetical protein D9C73_024704 [Collichthys lucidus]|uniref:Uncharacterized protein n=1 Tax=Collichthys lucidus TaxID=240159 RepID=A0A4U5VQV9_COLLU|nr:hypothetical protein D9C73_024704 [Collichthys lucidus]